MQVQYRLHVVETQVQYSQSAGRRWQLVVTCSNRKCRGDKGPRFQEVLNSGTSGRGPEAFLEEWVRQLGEHRPLGRADEVYRGSQWRDIRSMAEVLNVAPWICSAGYGFIPGSARIADYSATFTNRQADSIIDPGDWGWGQSASSRWWNLLAEWAGPCPGSARALRHLPAQGDGLLAVLSQPYLRVLRDDLMDCINLLGNENVLIFSTGSWADRDAVLRPSLLPLDGRLASVFGGPLATVSSKAALYLLRRLGPGSDFNATSAREELRRLLEEAPPLPRFDRQRQVDEVIISFIEAQLSRAGGVTPVTKGALLRRWRDSGQACEQRRFGDLFDRVVGSHQHAHVEEGTLRV